jgi:hypothetical protein
MGKADAPHGDRFFSREEARAIFEWIESWCSRQRLNPTLGYVTLEQSG